MAVFGDVPQPEVDQIQFFSFSFSHGMKDQKDVESGHLLLPTTLERLVKLPLPEMENFSMVWFL